MKEVTKAEWQDAVRQGNAGLDFKKTPWMLYLDERGATVWGPVTICDSSITTTTTDATWTRPRASSDR